MRNGLITMSAITGKPARKDIASYVTELCDNGIKEIMLYPRSGCEIEYLSEEWFDTIGVFLCTAKRLDMSIWLYDEFNWPSGDAGGRVSAKEKLRLKAIVTKGDEKGKISSYSRHNKNIFGEKYFPNLLSEEAVDLFIELTHEEYYKRFEKYFGSTIKGFFTDEPSVGYCSGEFSIPYYDELDADYKREYGASFFDSFEDVDFYKNSMSLISKRFNNCFIKKLKDWCESHGVLLTGHLMGDTEPYSATLYNGDYLKCVSSLSLPGVDEIVTGISSSYTLSIFGNAEYASNKNGAMAELFALGPCDLSYKTRRCMLYLASCFKINHYFLATSPMDMRGNMILSDYFSIFTSDQPDFDGMRLLAIEAEKACIFAEKDFKADVYIRYPTGICARRITERLDTLPFLKLLGALTENQIQWKYISDEVVDDAPVIKFDESFEPMINGKHFSIDSVCERINKKITVTDISGNTPKGIFVRKFLDGTTVVINRGGVPQTCIVDGEKAFLDKEDVFVNVYKEYSCGNEVPFEVEYTIDYKNDNIIRLMYINSQKRADISTEFDTLVSFAVRQGAFVSVDEEAVFTENKAERLPHGLECLYKESEKITLKKGSHVTESGNDFKYMPSVFVTGDFAARVHSGEICSIVLDKRKKKYLVGEKFNDYGRVEFFARVEIPKEAVGIKLCGTSLFTQVFFNDTLVGEGIYSYEFPLGKYSDTAELKIVQYSSLAPVFGDVGYYDKNSNDIGWKNTPSPKDTLFGFDKICWVLKGEIC